jgi:hypothetical protein
VVLWAGQRRFTGRIEFTRDHRQKHLFVNQGSITALRSNLVPEGIDMILGRGILKPGDVAALQAEASQGKEGDLEGHMFTALSRGKYLDASAFAEALEFQMEERLLNLMGWFEGDYELKGGVSAPLSLPRAAEIGIPDWFGRLERFLLSGESGFKLSESRVPPSSGDLRAAGGGTLMSALVRRKGNGRLIFERGARRKLFGFQDGRIATASSTDPSETLGVVLKRWKYLPAEVVDRAEATARSQGSRFREMILAEGLLAEEDLRSALVMLRVERILEALAWRSGRYEFQGALQTPESAALPAAPSPAPSKPSFSEAKSALGSDSSSILDPLFTQGVRSVLVLEPGGGASAGALCRKVVERWREKGIRSDLVEIAPGTDVGEDMANHRKKLEESHDRLLWLGGSPSAFPKVVVCVKAGRTGRRELRALLSEIPEGIPRYFFFEESFWSERLSRARNFGDKLLSRFRTTL